MKNLPKFIIKNIPAIFSDWVIAIETKNGNYYLDSVEEFISYDEAVERYGKIHGLFILRATQVK